MNLLEVKESFLMAWASLKVAKMRAFLTILGVLIGVTAVIGMVSIITGLNNSMAKQIQSLGSNVIYIDKYKPGIVLGNRPEEERNRKAMTLDDAEAIRQNCPSVGAVSPENHYWAPGGNYARFRDNYVRQPAVAGVWPDYEEVNNQFAIEGRFFTETDIHYSASIAILGWDIKEILFSALDPIGKEIIVNGHKFTVVGLMEKRKGILGESLDKFVLLPYGTFKKLYPQDKELSLSVRPKSAELMNEAIDEITSLLRRRRGVPADKPDNFAVFTQEDLMQLYRQITNAIYLVMIVISSIGLLVGGVGVMNIMLVSVKERTREIGVRKAIGARRKDILWQFLIEAMTLSGTGGVLGIIIGLLLSKIIDWVTPLPAGISLVWIIIGFSVSVSVGLIFGIYPAYRAAKQDPIVCLHYE
jgi:putative ABC transport system permease protein